MALEIVMDGNRFPRKSTPSKKKNPGLLDRDSWLGRTAGDQRCVNINKALLKARTTDIFQIGANKLFEKSFN